MKSYVLIVTNDGYTDINDYPDYIVCYQVDVEDGDSLGDAIVRKVKSHFDEGNCRVANDIRDTLLSGCVWNKDSDYGEWILKELK